MSQTAGVDSVIQIESAQRVMRIELTKEIDKLDETLLFWLQWVQPVLMWVCLGQFGGL